MAPRASGTSYVGRLAIRAIDLSQSALRDRLGFWLAHVPFHRETRFGPTAEAGQDVGYLGQPHVLESFHGQTCPSAAGSEQYEFTVLGENLAKVG